jgi:HSP20 family protein
MRYRRLSYRYSVVLTTGEPRPLGALELAERPGVRLAQTCWRPPADVYETPTAITVTVELAGVDPEEVEVLLFEDALVIEGQRRLPPTDEEGVYHAAQIRQGPFRLELALPAPIDAEHVGARSERGLLHITLAKAEGS